MHIEMVYCHRGGSPSDNLDVEEMKARVDKSSESVIRLAKKVAIDREVAEKAFLEIVIIDARLAVLKKNILEDFLSVDP